MMMQDQKYITLSKGLAMTTFSKTLRMDASTPRRRRSLLGWLGAQRGLLRQRRRLADLDAHLLDDIGVSEEQASREAKRAVWDVPSHWRL